MIDEKDNEPTPPPAGPPTITREGGSDKSFHLNPTPANDPPPTPVSADE